MACLALLISAAGSQAQAPDHQPLLRGLNALRAQGCDGRGSALPVLSHSPRLTDAAARLASGAKLETALQAADYRAVRAAQLTLNGYRGTAAVAQGAMSASCSDARYNDLPEVGIHRRGTQAWLVLAAPFSPPDAARAGEVQARVLALVNEARARPRRCGNDSFVAAPALQLNATLQAVAGVHAADMARHGYLEHTGRDGRSVSDRATQARYAWRAIGENIASGQTSADDAVQGWLKSPGHCANIMSPAFREMGAAFAVNAQSIGGVYWAQVFGAPR